MKEKYTVILIQAHEGETPDGHLVDVTTIELMEGDPEVALKRARKLIKKKHYRISSIIENYYHDKS
jgi:hypothetical protein